MSVRFGGPGESGSGWGFATPSSDEPEINLIPFIDVLLVVLIFLMLSTTYNKYSQLKINLPTANAEKAREFPREVHVGVSANGDYSVDNEALQGHGLRALATALRASAQGGSAGTPVLIVSADANATHQSVMTAIEAARLVGISQVTFALQSSATPGAE
jgi:biopolymer transport protein ExbD